MSGSFGPLPPSLVSRMSADGARNIAWTLEALAQCRPGRSRDATGAATVAASVAGHRASAPGGGAWHNSTVRNLLARAPIEGAPHVGDVAGNEIHDRLRRCRCPGGEPPHPPVWCGLGCIRTGWRGRLSGRRDTGEQGRVIASLACRAGTNRSGGSTRSPSPRASVLPRPNLPANWRPNDLRTGRLAPIRANLGMAAGTIRIEAPPNRHCPDAWRIWHEAGTGQPDLWFIQQATLGPASLGHNRSAPNHTSTKRNADTVCHS